MKVTKRSLFGLATAVACPVIAAIIYWSPMSTVRGVDDTAKTTNGAPSAVSTNAPAAVATNAPVPVAESATNVPSAGTNAAVVPDVKSTNASAGTNVVAATNLNASATDKAGSSTNEPPKDEVQVSFQGANIDMVAQWLAQTTGKSVIKHPRVQCQLTIMGGKKLTTREALNIIYRALSVEGNTVIETTKSIIIAPEGSEPKISPELVTTNVPEGKQRLVKVFVLQHAQAGDLRDKLKGLLTEKAQIDIDEKANRLMITDYNDNIALATDLVALLDTDNPADVTVRMITLKHVNAQNLAREIQPLYQKMKEKNPKEVVEISANDRSNSLIVMSSEPNFRAIEKLVASLDTSDAQEKVMQAFPLKNADAQDVAKQLKDLYADQDDSSGYSPYRYIIYGGMGGGGSSKKSSFVADRRRNAVIVQATPAIMPVIGEMIKALDEPITDDTLAPKIFHLKYVSAGDIEDILNELFLKKKQQRSYWSYYDDFEQSTPDRDVGRLYGKVRITSEPYANALIITANSPENLAAVEEVLKQLDQPSQAGDTTLRVPLKFAKASDVASSINILFAKGGAPPLRAVNQQQQQQYNQQQQQQNQNTTVQGADFELERAAKEDAYFPWLGGQPDELRNSDTRSGSRPVSDLVGRVRVVPDQRANAILISANMHLFPEVVRLIEDMDAPTSQVLIEAKIVEVSSDMLNRLGVRWSPDGSKTFSGDDLDNSISPRLTGEYKQLFGPTVAALAESQHTGLLDSTISLDFLIQFLKRTTEASVLAEPQINIADNEMGRLFVGSQVPFIDKSQTTDVGGLNQSFSYRNVGVILEVTPHINAAGDVALKIRAESSTIEPGQVLLGGAILDTRNFRTDMTARDGETVVLGGIIQKQVSETIRKVPLLGDIPGLGYLFKKKDKSSREVELMVFLRPRVARTSVDSRMISNEVEQRTPLIRDWQKKNLDGRATEGAKELKKEKKK